MAVFGYIIFPCYCGMVCNPLCSDVYGRCAHWLEYNENELVEKVKGLDKERLEEFAKRIEEHWRSLEGHRNACSALDCKHARARWNFDFNKQLLKNLGVKYVEKSCECKECTDEIDKMLEDSREPAEVVVENLPEDIYEAYFAW